MAIDQIQSITKQIDELDVVICQLKNIFFLSIWIQLDFRLIYGNQKFKLPAITNPILLQPATVLAKRIRERQITAYEVCHVYADRIRSNQPYLNVYVDERFDQALIEAKEIDRTLDDDKE
ncbi:unnamed protein product [Adineta steineri]|uniref:Uncharacterized protein n=1 Tax=Adineta steineri TaxID=433720 RepID=A0A816D036_9BILA|nr:unnamed protein product [Adineta steineri]CAF1442973.1 unnamed protein product [Adineta steineri]CAF1628328.1 unnamed protein product [Adineta steineri]CAF1628343.1 unnamed protein product [Adineta steineri]